MDLICPVSAISAWKSHDTRTAGRQNCNYNNQVQRCC